MFNSDAEKQEYINNLKQKLEEIDQKALRATRAVAAGTATHQDKLILEDLEDKAQGIREVLENLES